MKVFLSAMFVALAIEMILILPRQQVAAPILPSSTPPKVEEKTPAPPPKVEETAPKPEEKPFKTGPGVVLQGTKIYEIKNGTPTVTTRYIKSHLKCNVLSDAGPCYLIEIAQEGYQKEIFLVDKTGVFMSS